MRRLLLPPRSPQSEPPLLPAACVGGGRSGCSERGSSSCRRLLGRLLGRGGLRLGCRARARRGCGFAVFAAFGVATAALAAAPYLAGDVKRLCKAGFKAHVVPALEAESGSHGGLGAGL